MGTFFGAASTPALFSEVLMLTSGYLACPATFLHQAQLLAWSLHSGSAQARCQFAILPGHSTSCPVSLSQSCTCVLQKSPNLVVKGAEGTRQAQQSGSKAESTSSAAQAPAQDVSTAPERQLGDRLEEAQSHFSTSKSGTHMSPWRMNVRARPALLIPQLMP